MAKGGRKSKYDPLITPSLAEDYAKELLTDAQIAAKLGIHISTFIDWQKKYTVFSEAIKRGKAVSNIVKKRYIPPSTTTQIFLAKNRMPDEFRDVNRHKVEVESSLKVNTLAELMMEEYGHESEAQEVIE